MWFNRVIYIHTRKGEEWFYYNSTLKRTLYYPLVAFTLSFNKHITIEAPYNSVTIQLLGLISNFSRDIISGPKDALSIGTYSLYGLKSTKHIIFLVDFVVTKNITVNQTRDVIQKQKLDINVVIYLLLPTIMYYIYTSHNYSGLRPRSLWVRLNQLFKKIIQTSVFNRIMIIFYRGPFLETL